MAAGVQIEWTNRGAESVEKALDQINRGLQMTARRLDGVERASKKAQASTTTDFQKMTAGAAGFATSLIGVSSAAGAALLVLQQMGKEWENNLKRAKEAAQAQITAAEGMRQLRKSFQPDATLSAEQLEPRLEQVREATNSTSQIVAQVAGEAFSAKGALDNEAAVSAIQTALRVAPRDAGEATTLAARYLDLMNAGGVDDARQVAGFIGQLQANSRVKSISMVGSNLVPAINSLMTMGNTMEEAGEITATLNNLMSDAEGAVSKTAAIQLGNKLAQFVPETKAEDPHGKFKVPQEQIDAFTAARGTQAQIRVMQDNPELRRAFLAKNTFEAEATAPVKSLLAGDEKAVAGFRAVQQGIAPVDAASAVAFENQIEFFNSGRNQPLLDVEQGVDTAIEGKRLAEGTAGIEAKARETLAKTLAEIDTPGLDVMSEGLVRAEFEARVSAGQNPAAAAARLLRRETDPEVRASRGVSGQAPATPEERALALKAAEELDALAPVYKERRDEERAAAAGVDGAKPVGPVVAPPAQGGGVAAVDPENARLMQEQNRLLGEIAAAVKASPVQNVGAGQPAESIPKAEPPKVRRPVTGGL